MESLRDIRTRLDLPRRPTDDAPTPAPQGDGDSRPLDDTRRPPQPQPDALRDPIDHSA